MRVAEQIARARRAFNQGVLDSEASHALVQRAGHSVGPEALVAAAPARAAAAAPRRLQILTVGTDGVERPYEVTP